MRSVRTDQGRDAPVREQIKGHTVGSDGIVYNPDTASFGYVSSMDNRVTNNSSDERGVLVTDQGRAVPVNNVAALTVATASGGGGMGPGSVAVRTADTPRAAGSGPGAGAVLTGALKAKLKGTHTQLLLGGTGWTHNAGWSDTAEWEERYGEPGDWLGGIVTMVVDVGHNARRVWDQYGQPALDTHVKQVGEQGHGHGGNAWPALVDTYKGWLQQEHRNNDTGYVVPFGAF